jgi:magnesium transporter
MSINIPGRNRSQSPIHIRKNESPSEDVTVRARQSPTLGRSYNTQDELDSRERQRTLDVDMALQLSRARQNSVSLVSPAVVSPFHNPLTSSHGQLEHPPMAEHLPAFSEGEEREFEAARASGLGSAPPTMDGMHDAEPSEFGFPTDNSAVLNDSNEEARDADLLYTSAAAAETQDHRPKVPLAGREPFLPPMYQAAYGSNFDFGQMEDYARDEKRRLGLDTPMSPPAVLRWLDTPTAPLRQNGHAAGPSSSRQALNGDDGETNSVIGTDIGDGPVAGPSRIRQRKISQSAAVPRAGRGPGKKTALFEGVAGAPPPSLVPGAAIPASSAMSSHDNIFGGRSGYNPTATGGNNGGHDRPYRFSFYSNALSATIHARSLAELPADGQTFEQLFQGLHPDADFEQPSVPLSAHPTLASAAGTPLQTGAINLASRRVSVARGGLAPGYGMSETTPVPGASASKAALPLQSGASADGNTWWLDVLSPTDEEMKMLSKVNSLGLPL